MERDKLATSRENFEGGPAGCVEGLWRREYCEGQRGGPFRCIGTIRQEKKEGNGQRSRGECYDREFGGRKGGHP